MSLSEMSVGISRPVPHLSDQELADLNEEFELLPAGKIVQWARDTFGSRLCLAASMQDAVLIDVATKVDPGIEVVFVDTGYHVPETLETLDRVARRYDLNVNVVRNPEPLDDLWMEDPDACCEARKVKPLEDALAGRAAWMSGLRRAESATRANAPIVSRDKRGLVKINPLANWDDLDIEGYVADHDVVVNPLLSQGYTSIGCWPCTRAVKPGEDPRAGRWTGFSKTECGLHD
ncbi:MAG: phosphoadenylyl-sulfate reductase [Actinomycetota bacterium]